MVDWVYSPDRITSPMKKINGDWEEITWEEAFDIFCKGLNQLKEKYGAKSLAAFSGNAFAGTYDMRAIRGRFLQLYGTPNATGGASFCHWAHTIGQALTFSHSKIELVADFEHANCIINWGRNPEYSRHHALFQIEEAKRRGAKVIVIDPRRTKTAKLADIHAQIRPCTDCALALGMLNVIINEDLYDHTFVEDWTLGFDELKAHVQAYPPEKVAEITWIPADMIEEIARTYAKVKPATIFQYIATDHSTNGVQATRAISSLMAITGNYGIRGGNPPCPFLKTAKFSVKEAKVAKEEGLSHRDYPLYTKIVGSPSASPLTEAMISGKPYPIKGLIIEAANPALTWPNNRKFAEAVKNLDLMVVIDLFMTETAQMADLFLPATTFLERKNLFSYTGIDQLPYFIWVDRIIDPLGEAMDDWRIWVEMGRRMGYGKEYFPWDDSDEIFRDYLEPSSIDFEELKAKPEGVFYAGIPEKEYLKSGFTTPSGKVELYSKTLEEFGYEPLPNFQEPVESPVSTPELAQDFPLILISGAKVHTFTHSNFRQIQALRKMMPEPLLEIHPQTADDLAIKNGDRVRVESKRGGIVLIAKVAEDIHPQVVSMQHGWAEASVNVLTDDMDRDPISGFPSFGGLCRVAKV
jgi:anaerobic selenocysteine-containing dehydrogenase